MSGKHLFAVTMVMAALWVAGSISAPAAHASDVLTAVKSAPADTAEPALIKITTQPVETKIILASTHKSEASSTDNADVTEYVVQPGDYLEKIAREHSVDWPSIYEINPEIVNPDTIYPFKNIKIPHQNVTLTREIPATSTLKVPATQPVAAKSAAQRLESKKARPARTAPVSRPAAVSGRLGLGNALSFVGYPYVWGGNTPAGFDCSGFTQYIAAQQGISLPRTVMAQYGATHRISQAELRPGDLVFFNAHHVGMYIGNGQIIHAATPALGVRIDSLSSAIAYNGYMGAGRI
jgi:cell wall-associated NlpC family hydrolase